MELEKANTEVEKSDRDKILDFENGLKQFPDAFLGDSENCPLTHSFADGIYMRQIEIPKGMLIVGKIHKHSHPNVLLKGSVSVFTEEEGEQRLEAPLAMISKAGTKRVVYSHEDCVWLTFHSVGNETDLDKIEDIVIAKDYNKLEEFKQNKKGG